MVLRRHAAGQVARRSLFAVERCHPEPVCLARLMNRVKLASGDLIEHLPLKRPAVSLRYLLSATPHTKGQAIPRQHSP